MSERFKSQQINRGSISDIIQLLDTLSSGNRRKTAEQEDLRTEFSQGLSGIFDNNLLAQRKQQFDNYFEQNKMGMNEATLAKYELLNQQFKQQEQMNRDYEQGKMQIRDVGEKLEQKLLEYSDINAQDIDNDKRAALRKQKMDEISRLQEDYLKTSGDYKSKHFARLGTRANASDAQYIDNMNELFVFGIAQAEDDFVLDKAEARALSLGIQSGSFSPIEDYRTKEKITDNAITEQQMKRQNELYQSYATTKEVNNKVSDYLMQSEIAANAKNEYTFEQVEQAKTELLNKSQTSFYTDDDDNQYFYEDLLTAGSDADVLQKQFLDFEDSFFNELSNIDASYTKRMGKSYLKEINTDETIKDDINMILGIKPVSVVPPPPPPPPSGEQEDKSSISSIKPVDFSNDSKQVKSYAEKEIEKTGKEINAGIKELEDYAYDGTLKITRSGGIGPSMLPSKTRTFKRPEPGETKEFKDKGESGVNELNKLLGNKDLNAPISYSDIQKLKKDADEAIKEMQQLEADMENMKKLGIDYDDARRVEARKKLENLSQKWLKDDYLSLRNFYKSELDKKGGYFGMPPNSPMTAINTALFQIGIIEEKNQKKLDKYNRDLINYKK